MTDGPWRVSQVFAKFDVTLGDPRFWLARRRTG